ncbi:MAG: hypothetical protein M0Z82_03190 [Actinomycetota bacterium]|nr:hypothetical protein [Actinomycetota bacterium]
MDPANLPEGPVEQVGAFVGTGVGATTFPTVVGVTPRNLWGYLALQLGGPRAPTRRSEPTTRACEPQEPGS